MPDQLPVFNSQECFVESGSGGLHLWFAHPAGLDVISDDSFLAPGVDIKVNSGCFLVPPSKTQDQYSFEITPDETDVSNLPPWMINSLNGSVSNQETTKEPVVERIGEVVPQGTQHGVHTTSAGSTPRVGMNEVEIETE